MRLQKRDEIYELRRKKISKQSQLIYWKDTGGTKHEDIYWLRCKRN